MDSYWGGGGRGEGDLSKTMKLTAFADLTGLTRVGKLDRVVRSVAFGESSGRL